MARRFNLVGTTDLEQGEADMYIDHLADLFSEMVKVYFEANEAKKAELTAKLQAEGLPHYMKLITNKLSQSISGFIIGNGLTWVDLYLISILDGLGENKQGLLAHFPAVKAHNEKINAIPKIAAWLAARPVTQG